MPTLPNRLLRHHQPSPSPDNLYIDEQVGEHYRRSLDEPRIGPSQETAYSHLPAFFQQPARRLESSILNSKSHTRSRSHPFPSLFSTGRKRSDSLNLKARATHDFVDDDDDDEDDDDDDYAPQLDGSSSPGRRKGNLPGDPRRIEERDTETGHCMTCNSQVKWPRGLKTFRCASCLTVNDLERWNRHASGKGRHDEPVAKQGISHSPTVRKPILLSVDRLQSLIERCTTDYLRYRLGIASIEHDEVKRRTGNHATKGSGIEPSSGNPSERAASQPHVPQAYSPVPARGHIPSDDIQLSALVELPVKTRRLSFDNSSREQKLGKDHDRATDIPAIPIRRPPLPPMQRKDRPPPMRFGSDSSEYVHANKFQTTPYSTTEDFVDQAAYETAKSYFRPLEDHINASFRNAECLNASFVTGRLSHAERARSEGFVSTVRKAQPDSLPPSASEAFSELDQKTLLLADVAENGLWWTGKAQRLQQSPERIADKRSTLSFAITHNVSHRSVRINWHDVSQWYDNACNVDQSWRAILGKVLEDPSNDHSGKDPQKSEDLTRVESELKYIRHHFRRVLLKATDSLLKRPGYPCRDANDIRFLLIILANPLFNASEPTTGAFHLRRASQTAQKRKDASPRPKMGHSKSSEAGAYPFPAKSIRSSAHHWELIKRVLGLLSNLPIHCHNQLVSWFCRYDEERFRNTVDLVAQFVTYRMSRQSGKKATMDVDPTTHLIPDLSELTSNSTAQLHAALELGRSSSQKKEKNEGVPQIAVYSEDWQLVAAAKVMALLFTANNIYYLKRSANSSKGVNNLDSGTSKTISSMREQQQQQQRQKQRPTAHGQLLPTSHFYNSLLDYVDLIADFEAWQSRQVKFSFTQYHFFISIGAKTKLMEYDAKRQMDSKARDAFFDNIFRNRNLEQFFQLKVRRNCLIEDSLGRISEVVGAGQEGVKKGLRVQFAGEEGVDAGGLRKEWFLLLVRELFDPNNGMFIYDEDSHLCYFNPNTFEKSDQYFLVGAVIGLAIYNSTILDIPLPPFAFKKLLANASAVPSTSSLSSSAAGSLNLRHATPLTLDDLSDYQPALAQGLRRLLEFEGEVETFCLDFVIETDRYGEKVRYQLCPDGDKRQVTNKNRHEYVELYVQYLLDSSVDRQFAPFQRGFYTVCSGKALGLFRPEEIELLVRGSDEALDVLALKAVAIYENWPCEEENAAGGNDNTNNSTTKNELESAISSSPRRHHHHQQQHRNRQSPQMNRPGRPEPKAVSWFWELFNSAEAQDQRKILSFITGSDRIPAQGPASLVIKIVCAGEDCERFPVARTCFNMLMLYRYGSRQKLVKKLWRAVLESEGFGLK